MKGTVSVNLKSRRNIFAKKVPNTTKSYVKRVIKQSGELSEAYADSDLGVNSSLTLDTWTSDNLTQVAQGDDSTNRQGDKIELTGRLYFAINVGFPGIQTTDAASFPNECRSCRVIIVQLKRNATQTNLNTILTKYEDSPTSNLKKFELEQICYILYDKVFVESDAYYSVSQGTTATSLSVKPAKLHVLRTYVKPKCTTLVWNPATKTAVQPDIQGAIYAYYLYNNTASGGSPELPDVQLSTDPSYRFTFRDK